MKFIPFLNKFIFLLILITLIVSFLISKVNATTDEDFKRITSKLRCMTCQNQTIYDSDADFSLDIKKIIKEKLQNNEDEKEIINFLIHRYGEYIAFEPQMNKRNIFLWFFPFIIMALCLAFLVFRIKKNQ